jgi:FixJ family two-component response regulator
LPAPEAAPIVSVVDEDIFVRQALELLLLQEGWQPETFASAGEFLARPRPLVPNCLILEVSLPGLSGLELQKRLANDRPGTPVIFITGYGDVPIAVQAMKAGAVEFLTKPFTHRVVVGAVRHGIERSRAVLQRERDSQELRATYASLSAREREVMALVVSGMLNKQAGGQLGISEVTVKAHRGRVMQKMKADSLADLVKIASRIELVAMQ